MAVLDYSLREQCGMNSHLSMQWLDVYAVSMCSVYCIAAAEACSYDAVHRLALHIFEQRSETASPA